MIASSSARTAVGERSSHSILSQRSGLIWTLIRTDFKTRYHGTLQGFIWALLKPLMMFLVLLSVFSFIFKSEPAYRLNLIIGLFLWDFFAQSTSVGMTSLYTKGYLLTKAKFPSWIIVVTSVSNSLITVVVFFGIVVGALAYSGRTPGPAAIALFFVYLLQFLAIVVGFSLASSVLFVRYRDLNQVWDVVIQAGFFLAPIVYPLNILPDRVRTAVYLWPPTPVVEFARAALVQGTPASMRAHVFLTLEALTVLAVGIGIFRRYGPRAAEYL